MDGFTKKESVDNECRVCSQLPAGNSNCHMQHSSDEKQQGTRGGGAHTRGVVIQHVAVVEDQDLDVLVQAELLDAGIRLDLLLLRQSLPQKPADKKIPD